jgi:hypothetical protein
VSAGIAVREATDADAPRWDAFLLARPLARPLAIHAWRRVLADAYGTETRFLLAERGGAVAGVLPLYVTRKPGRAPSIYSLRFGLEADDAAAAALLDHARAFAEARGASWSVSSVARHEALAPAPRLRKTVTLALAPTEGAAWTSLRDKTRNMIRKAEKAGVTVVDGPEWLDDLHRLYAATMLRKDVPVHGRAFFRALGRHLAPHMTVLAARRDGRTIGAMALIGGGAVACYPYQAASEEGRAAGAIPLLNWAAMRHAIAGGATLLDMGESAEGGPVFRAKVNFGGTPADIFYRDNRSPAETEAGAGGGKRSLAGRVLSRAPGFVRGPISRWRLRTGRIV